MQGDSQKLRVGYFVNQYPAISHSFIRREIQALERAGVCVERMAIRPSKDDIVSDEDRAEFSKTRHIVRTGKPALLKSILKQTVKNPVGAVKAFASAFRHGLRSEAGLFRHFLYYGEALVLADWVERSELTHLHAHFGTNATMIAMLAAKLGGFSFSFTVHGPEEFEKPDLISLPQKIRAASFVVAISHYGRAQLKKLTPPEIWPNLKIVHCGIERDFYADASLQPHNHRTLVCVGRLCAEKGQIDLVRAFAKIESEIPDALLRLIGDGPMRQAISVAIGEAGLEERILLDGWKSPDQVRAALVDAGVFVLPSYAEGLPVSIMEALSLGRPVISTYIAGIPELLENDKCGWLIPAGDVDALAAAIKAALTANDNLIAEFGAEGRRRVLQRHDIDTEAQKLAGHFRKAV
ncbi:MAG: glycosyltransferase [Pseudomonadota bacterium]